MWNSSAMWDRFVDAVGRRFRFLETEFGFAQTSTKPPFVTYESDMLQVLVFYDALPGNRHELDLGIRRLGDDLGRVPSIGIGVLMLSVDRRSGEQYMSPFPSTPEALEAEVQRLAELLRRYGGKILRGDKREFKRIERLRREREGQWGTRSRPESPPRPPTA